MDAACSSQYDNPAAVGRSANLDDAYSWRCYEVSALESNTTCLPDSLSELLEERPNPGTPIAEPGGSDFGEDGTTSTEEPTDADAPAPIAADPCAWRGTFDDGFTLAGERAMVELEAVSRRARTATVDFDLLEPVAWKVCVRSLGSRSWQKCGSGSGETGTHEVSLTRKTKVPRAVQVRFSDIESGALESYDVRFEGKTGEITRAPTSLSDPPPLPAMRAELRGGVGYPEGVGDFLHNNPFADWIQHVISKNWWIGYGYHTCLNLYQKYWFIEYYKREQAHIRQHFSPGYNLGRPATAMRINVTGFAGTSWRFYQLFDGGSWGRSTLTAPRSEFLGNSCSQKPHLITGAIFRKWEQLGHVNTMGGPLGGQYREGPFVKQNFEKGQIGFRDGNLGTVWYRFGNGPWQT